MCDYQGQHFGASYEDGACIDVFLWDLDSCDEPGGLLSFGGEIPCPNCNAKDYEKYYEEDYEEDYEE